MTRQEHLDWCKARAREYLDRGDASNAIASMMSDMQKHEETSFAIDGILGKLGAFALMNGSLDEAWRYVEGFN